MVQALEELILKERKQLEKTNSKFPVLQNSRLQDLIEESRLNLKMDRSEIQQAIKFLHECGVILHYSDLQTKLSELYFLDPEWLCTLMAHIITLKHISFVDEKGVSAVCVARLTCDDNDVIVYAEESSCSCVEGTQVPPSLYSRIYQTSRKVSET